MRGTTVLDAVASEDYLEEVASEQRPEEQCRRAIHISRVKESKRKEPQVQSS